MKFVITYPYGGANWDRFTIVHGLNETMVRLRLQDVLGPHGWSMIYRSEEEAGVHKYGLREIPLPSLNGEMFGYRRDN